MTGAERIAEERKRQIAAGYTPEHDTEHACGELAKAGYAYLRLARHQIELGQISDPHATRLGYQLWPWEDESWQPSANPIDNLAKAGALISAEIDRLNAQGVRNGPA